MLLKLTNRLLLLLLNIELTWINSQLLRLLLIVELMLLCLTVRLLLLQLGVRVTMCCEAVQLFNLLLKFGNPCIAKTDDV